MKRPGLKTPPPKYPPKRCCDDQEPGSHGLAGEARQATVEDLSVEHLGEEASGDPVRGEEGIYEAVRVQRQPLTVSRRMTKDVYNLVYIVFLLSNISMTGSMK